MKLSGVFQRMKYNFLNKEIFRQHKYVFKFLNKGIHSGYQNTMPRTVNMKYGDKVASVFSSNEYDRRLGLLRTFMVNHDIEACVFTSYHNINYFSGFLYCYFGRSYALVVTQDGSTTVSAGIDGGQPWRRCYGDNVTYTDWKKDNYYHTIKGLTGDVKGKVGLEYDHVSKENFPKFQDICPKCEIVDVGNATMKMRMIKSTEEIELIKNAAQIADIGGQAVVDTLQEGVPEHEVALASTQTMVREIAKRYPHTDIMDTWTWFQSGLNTDGAHNPVTTRKVQPGDVLSLNCFPMIAGYYVALERTLFLGHASDACLELWQHNVDVHNKGLKLVRPGIRCCDIAKELNELYKEKNLLQYRSFGYGHSFGTLCHYYGREAGLELREDITTMLEPGMVVSMEPMIMVPPEKPGAGGYREHDILVLKEDGTENITGFPYGPEYNIIRK